MTELKDLTCPECGTWDCPFHAIKQALEDETDE